MKMKNEFIREIVRQTALLAAGSILCVFSISVFLIPNELLSGGIIGFALLLYYAFKGVVPLPVGLIYFLINIPIFILGWRFVGRRFIAYSLLGMTIYSLALNFMKVPLKIYDPMLAAVMAGFFAGVGIAVI